MSIKNPGKGVYKYFPYRGIRKDQDRLVEDLNEFLNSPIKVALIKGDTGLGKEVAIASQIVRFKDDYDHIIHLVPTDTGKINIEKEIAVIKDKFPGLGLNVVVLRNKEEMCYLLKEAKKEDKFQEKELDVYSLCDRNECLTHQKGLCSYYQNIEKIKTSNLIICDYNYVFDPYIRKSIFGDMFEKKSILLLINEVHELPDRITNQFSHKINLNLFQSVIKELEGNYLREEDRVKFRKKLGNISEEISIVKTLEKSIKSYIGRSYDKFFGTVDNKVEVNLGEVLGELKKKYNLLLKVGYKIIKWKMENGIGNLSHTKVLGRFLQQVNFAKNLEYYFSYIEKHDEHTHSIGIACMNPYPLIKEPFELADKIIMYSGTLYPERYMRLFMLSKFGEVFVPEPYKAEYLKNRVDIFYSDGKLTKDYRDSKKLKKSADDLYEILKRLPKPCAIFAVRPLWNKIRKLMDLRKYKVEEEKFDADSEEKKIFLQRIRKADIIVLSPYGSFKQSIDMSFLESIIILGICDPMLDLITKKTLDYYKQKYLKIHGIGSDWISYELICRLPAIEKSLQAAGRGIRKESDHLLAVWFDERWITQSRFISSHNKKHCMDLPSLLKEVELYKKNERNKTKSVG